VKELWKKVSQNGRRGLALVGPDLAVLPRTADSATVLGEGALRPVGVVAGVATFEFVPGTTGTWVAVAGDCKVHGGATVAAEEDLQGGSNASILLLAPEAVVEHYGYKRRGSHVVAYVHGCEQDIPATVLAAMGLVAVDGTVAEVAPPPPLAGAMASAFAALRPQ